MRRQVGRQIESLLFAALSRLECYAIPRVAVSSLVSTRFDIGLRWSNREADRLSISLAGYSAVSVDGHFKSIDRAPIIAIALTNDELSVSRLLCDRVDFVNPLHQSGARGADLYSLFKQSLTHHFLFFSKSVIAQRCATT